MYGTLARFSVQPGKMNELKELMTATYADVEIPGRVFAHAYQADNNPDELWLAVGFTDEAAYRANSTDPAQNARHMAVRSLLSADPDWHDGSIVYSM